MQLGYAGYPEFQRALEEMVMNRLNSVQRMQFTYGRVPQGEILETVLQSDIEKIKMVHYLVKVRGMKLAAAQEQILHNRKNVSKRQEVAERLEEIKTELQSLADALDGIWKRGRENSPVSE